jgi:hypothetical protein
MHHGQRNQSPNISKENCDEFYSEQYKIRKPICPQINDRRRPELDREILMDHLIILSENQSIRKLEMLYPIPI